MYCSKCGNQISDDALFCDKCGTKIERHNENVVSDTNNVNIENASNENSTNNSPLNNKTNLFTIAAAVLSIIATFLPFITINVLGTTMQRAYIEADGVAIVIVAILAIVFTMLNKKIAVIVCGVVNLVILLIDTYNLIGMAGQNELANAIAKSMIIKGPGFYLLYITTIGLLLASIYNIYNKGNYNNILNVSEIGNKINGFVGNINNKVKEIDFKDVKVKRVLYGIIGIVLLIVAIYFGLSLRNPGRFVKNIYGDKQYKFRDGTFAKREWVTHNGKEYHFDDKGKMETNDWVGVYYVDDKGVKRKNYFINAGDDTYYLKNDGRYARNELVDVNGKTYAFDDDGKNLKNQLWENATPSYTAYVTNHGVILKGVQGEHYTSDGLEIYIKDSKTGAIVVSDWIKPDPLKGYIFYDENGIRQKDKIIAEMDLGEEKYYYVYDDTNSFAYGIVRNFGPVNISNSNYYYVNSIGYMAKNITREIGGTEWVFDNEGKGQRELWVQGQYKNTTQNYIINKKKLKGISCYDIEKDWESAYLDLCFDKIDIAFFLYDENLKKIENDYRYINRDYTLLLSSKVNKNYKFTGTLRRKDDRIYIDNYQAIATIKNHLITGQPFLLYLRENGSYSKTYMFWIETFNFPQVYDDTFAIKNGWRGDSYYVNNIKVTNQWQEYDGNWYYLGSDGNMVKNKWVDNEYYVDKDGKMLKDTITPDGYKVDKNGKYIK